MISNIFRVASLALLITSCEKYENIAPTYPSSIKDLRFVTIQQVDYDSLIITNSEELIVTRKDIEFIVFGKKKNGTFVGQDTITPVYYSNGLGDFILEFEFQENVDLSEIKYEFTIRYMKSNSWVSLDTFALMYKYPYESTIPILLAGRDLNMHDIHFQDIDLDNENLYFHPSGSPSGLYEYNFDSRQARMLVNYYGGDNIASDSIYVFYATMHDEIFRYNLNIDTTNLMLDLTEFESIDYGYISGMDICNGILYVLVISYETESNNSLVRFDLDCNYIDIRNYPLTHYYMTIHDNILYSVQYTGSSTNIARFDLTSNTFLENIPTPALLMEGIRIFRDRLYYTDYYKKMIGSIHLWDIE